jgi:hypothetical protein
MPRELARASVLGGEEGRERCGENGLEERRGIEVKL